MKKQLTLLLATAFAGTLSSQVVLSEDFNDPFQLSVGGWTIQNNSNPTNGTWMQGDGTNFFTAYNGGADDYIAVAFNSTGTNGDISNWLISPTVSIYNGAVVQFATRVSGPTITYPDRLQLRMSPTAAYSIPSGTASVGTFSVLMLDINPNLTTNVASAVNNGSVNGYPVQWTVYSVPVTGVTGTVTGRFAFRYAVHNSGSAGSNGDYVGIDAFRYMLPCGAQVPSYTVCAGTSVTLAASGAASGATYTWNPGGSNASSIVVNPVSTTVYTLTTTESTGQCPAKTATVTVGSNLNVEVSSTSASICPGQTATLSAMSAATNYSWMNNSATTSTTAVSPTVTTIYTVVAGNFAPPCAGANTIQVFVKPSPSLSVTFPANPLCMTGSSTQVTLVGNGANAYAWVIGTVAVGGQSLNLNVPATASQIFTFQLLGSANGCTAGITSSLVIDTQPTVSIASSANTVCTNGSVTFTASGAASYQWSGASTSTNASFSYSAPATAGTQTFNVAGTSSLGCTANASKTISVLACGQPTSTVGLDENGVFVNTSVFPNPFVNELKITALDGTVIIYNALGQVVLNQKVEGSTVINTSEFAKGTYVVKAINMNGETVKTVRVVKN